MKLIPFAFLFLSLTLSAQTNGTEKVAPGTSRTNTEKAEQGKSDKAFPIGPYKDGKYLPPAGEEKQAEEALLQEKQDETRVNKMGPNKR